MTNDNLFSIKRSLRGKALIEYKKRLKLNLVQKDILIGTLLGDATIIKQTNKTNFNIKFEQKIFNSDYINHLYEIFEPYVGTPPRIRNIKGGGAQDRQSIWFRTYRHIDFKFYYDLFYIEDSKTLLKKKRVPQNIHKFLTAKALAYWFMDDGTKFTKNNNNYYYLSTQSFPLEDQKILVKALKRNFNLTINIHKDRSKYKLYILTISNVKFIELIKDFIHPCFVYKL